MLPKNRRSAVALSKKHYFTGKSCKSGHIAERYTSHGDCVVCSRKRNAEKRKRNPERDAERRKRRRARALAEEDFGWFNKSIRRHKGVCATKDELRDQWRKQNGKCGLTGMSLCGVRPHLDHKIALSAGGASTIDNLHWTHPTANHAKNSYTTEEFRAWLLAAADALRYKIALEALL